MAAEWIPNQVQLSKCQRKIRNNLKNRENEKDVKDRLIKVTKHWNYGANPQKTKSRLGVNTIYPRLDGNTFRNELSNIINKNKDKNDDIYKTASYLLRVTKNINFWLLKGVYNNGDKIFSDHDNGDIVLYKEQLLAEFNLSAQIDQSWDVINDRLYGCKLCVYYKGNKYHGSWIKVIDRDAFAVAFCVNKEYRMSYCPAMLVEIGGIGLIMVLSGSSIIDNKKHIGFGFCNIIKKTKIIDGHSMIHILQENKHDVHVEFYATNNADILVEDIKVILEPHNLKKNNNNNKKAIILFPMQNNDGMMHDTNNQSQPVDHRSNDTNNMIMTDRMNVNGISPNPEMMNNNNNNTNNIHNPNMSDRQFENDELSLIPYDDDNISTMGYSNYYNVDLSDIQSVATNDTFGYGIVHTATHSVENTRVNPLGHRGT